MKRLPVVVTTICLFLGLAGLAVAGEENSGTPSSEAAAAAPEGSKVVAARVNGAAISEGSVVRMMNRIKSKKGQNAPESGETDTTRKEALDRLIFQELAYQKAKQENLTVDPKKLDDAMASVQTNLGGEEEYKKFLEKEGLTEAELRAQVEKSLILDLIISKEVREKATVSEDEIKKEYELNKDKFVKQERVVVTDVVFFLDTKDAGAARKAEEVLQKIQADKDKDPRNLVPDGTFVVREMLLTKDKEPVLYEAAKKLTAGELSGVLTTADSINIIKLNEYVPEKRYTLEEVRGTVETKLKSDAQKKRLHEWENELRKGATIELGESGVTASGPGKN